MVWAYFWGKNRGALCPIVVKSVNIRVYLKLLECLVLPVMQRINDTISDAVFQQDNAPVHTTLAVTDGLSSTTSRSTNTLPTRRTSIPSNLFG